MPPSDDLRAEPTVRQELADRKAQRDRLAQVFIDNPRVIWTQETMALMCGADIGAVRTRLSELRKDANWRRDLRAHSGSYIGPDGVAHRGKKQWQYVPADVQAPTSWPVFDAPSQEPWSLKP